MNAAKECFDTAANLLQQATGCPPAIAAMIVKMIALGIRWTEEPVEDEAGEHKRWTQRRDGTWERHQTA